MLQNRYKQLKNFTEGNGLLPIALAIVTVLIGVAYIWQVNVSATAGFEMRELTQSIEELEMDQDKLDLKVARLQSVDSVSTRVQMLGLSKVKRVEYLTPGSGAVAINR